MYADRDLINSLRICEGACNKKCILYNSVQVDGDTCQNRLCAMAADAIEELQGRAKVLEKIADKWCDAVPKWIPVTERLPEEKTYVLILADTIAGKMEKVSFLYKDSESRNCWAALDAYGKNLFDWQPTHWMPLPEPPKEG